MHQSRYREQTGFAQLDRTQWDIAQAELLNFAETEWRFFSAFYHQRLRDLTESAAKPDEKLLGVLGRRFEAGQAAAADVTLTQIEARSARRLADLDEAKYATALVDLRTHLELERTVSIELLGDLEKWRRPPTTIVFPRTSPTTLQPDAESDAVTEIQWEQLMAGRPDMMAAHAAVQAAKAQYDVAWAPRVPNVSLTIL